MKARRILPILLAVLLCISTSAMAATSAKEAAKKPVVKLNAVGTLESGQYEEVKVNASVPGFLKLEVTNAVGGTVLTLADNAEEHSGDNSFSWTAYQEDGEPLGEGDYGYVATLTSQFGVDSDPVTRGFKVVAPEEEEDDGVSSALTTTTSAVTGKNSTSRTSTGSSSSSSNTAALLPDEPVAYSRSSNQITIGDEGLEIGVGVADVYPQNELTYWTLPGTLTDAEIWQALIHPITVVNLDEQESTYIYDSVSDGHTKLGTITGASQGVNVLVERQDGWSLVEAYRNEDGAFVRGYIKSNRLKVTEVNQTYGILIDKNTQTLYVYMNGQMIGSCMVCTGKPTVDALNRETPAGEFITVMRRGTVAYLNRGFSKYTIRINNTVHLQEIPSTKKNGTDFSLLEDYLGTKSTRGTICVQHLASNFGGINAEWIWDMTENNKRVKVLILDDKDRASVPIGN